MANKDVIPSKTSNAFCLETAASSETADESVLPPPGFESHWAATQLPPTTAALIQPDSSATTALPRPSLVTTASHHFPASFTRPFPSANVDPNYQEILDAIEVLKASNAEKDIDNAVTDDANLTPPIDSKIEKSKIANVAENVVVADDSKDDADADNINNGNGVEKINDNKDKKPKKSRWKRVLDQGARLIRVNPNSSSSSRDEKDTQSSDSSVSDFHLSNESIDNGDDLTSISNPDDQPTYASVNAKKKCQAGAVRTSCSGNARQAGATNS